MTLEVGVLAEVALPGPAVRAGMRGLGHVPLLPDRVQQVPQLFIVLRESAAVGMENEWPGPPGDVECLQEEPAQDRDG